MVESSSAIEQVSSEEDSCCPRHVRAHVASEAAAAILGRGAMDFLARDHRALGLPEP